MFCWIPGREGGNAGGEETCRQECLGALHVVGHSGRAAVSDCWFVPDPRSWPWVPFPRIAAVSTHQDHAVASLVVSHRRRGARSRPGRVGEGCVSLGERARLAVPLPIVGIRPSDLVTARPEARIGKHLLAPEDEDAATTAVGGHGVELPCRWPSGWERRRRAVRPCPGLA